MSVCLSIASDSSGTIEVTINKHGTMNSSDMRMHPVLIILTVTVIQGHTDLDHENNKYSNISQTVQAMPIKFTVKIVRLKIYLIFSQTDDLTLHSRSQVRLKLGEFFLITCTIILIYRTIFNLWHSNLA